MNHLFISNSPTSFHFRTQLSQLIAIGRPFAKAITCLESSHSTAGDVYLFWMAISASVKAVLDATEYAIPLAVKSQIRAIVNSRWKEIFEDENSGAHLTALYLNPGIHCAILSFFTANT